MRLISKILLLIQFNLWLYGHVFAAAGADVNMIHPENAKRAAAAKAEAMRQILLPVSAVPAPPPFSTPASISVTSQSHVGNGAGNALKEEAWHKDCDAFVKTKLANLRSTRTALKRSPISFRQVIPVLRFIKEGGVKHGAGIIAASEKTCELLIDVCDIVNLQHPDFKKRYDILLEQWDGFSQKPFSLFSFDRIAQAFHFRKTLFHNGDGSAYRGMLSRIISMDLPILAALFAKIGDLEAAYGTLSGEPELHEINSYLDDIILDKGTEKAKAQKLVRAKFPAAKASMKGLQTLSAMAHDYLTLGRITKAAQLLLNIPVFTTPEHREAFLAGIIQIGELASNKNLSTYVRSFMPTIPWEGLTYCRNAIEHQDEHGFNIYFKGIVEGTNTSVDFLAWRDEMKELNQRIIAAKMMIWGADPKAKFEKWLQAEIYDNPTYGVLIVPQPIESKIRSSFKETPLAKKNRQLWANLLNGGKIQKTSLELLRNEIERLKTSLSNLAEYSDKQHVKEKEKAEKFLEACEDVEMYLWNRLKTEAPHLDYSQKDLLVRTATAHIAVPAIADACFALLQQNQSYLTTINRTGFVSACLPLNIVSHPFLTIWSQLRPEMPITRAICTALPSDHARDLDQPARRAFAQAMFVETSTHLHNLAHGQKFTDRMFEEMKLLPIKYAWNQKSKTDPKFKALEKKIDQIHMDYSVEDAYGYYNLTAKGNALALKETKKSKKSLRKLSFPKMTTAEFKAFSKERMADFYRRAHRVFLADAIQNKPTAYLASVYTLSVGYGALKGWLKREAVAPAAESNALEKLRDGRNFIAHGDLFRDMNGIDLADVQEGLLTDHLDHCQMIGAT